MESNLKIVEWDIDKLISAEYNPRKLSEEQKQKIKDSISRFGLVDPVIVNTNKDRFGIIIGGHQRTKVSREMGFKKMPCVELDLTLDQEKELNIRLNKNTGAFDFELLNENFNNSDLIDWGFEDEELTNFDAVTVEDLKEGEELEIEQSLQVIPKKEYIIIMADEGSTEWDELRTIFKCQTVRQGGCQKGSTSDKATSGLERVFDLKSFKERIGI